MLSLTMKDGDYFVIGDDIKITFSKSSYRGALSVGIDAPRSMKVVRNKLLEKIADEKAAAGDADGLAMKEQIRKDKEDLARVRHEKEVIAQYVKEKKMRKKKETALSQ